METPPDGEFLLSMDARATTAAATQSRDRDDAHHVRFWSRSIALDRFYSDAKGHRVRPLRPERAPSAGTVQTEPVERGSPPIIGLQRPIKFGSIRSSPEAELDR